MSFTSPTQSMKTFRPKVRSTKMLKNGLGAVEALTPKLEYVIFPAGTKGYGVHLPNRPFTAPFREGMCDSLFDNFGKARPGEPKPWPDELFYYVLHNNLDEMQRGKNWMFAEVRCDIVLGFVPHSNPNNGPAI